MIRVKPIFAAASGIQFCKVFFGTPFVWFGFVLIHIHKKFYVKFSSVVTIQILFEINYPFKANCDPTWQSCFSCPIIKEFRMYVVKNC